MKKLFLLLLLPILISGCRIGPLVIETNDYENNYLIKEIKQVIYYRDGGTIGVWAIKKDDVELKFCLSGRASSDSIGHFFMNALHPDLDSAKKMDIDSTPEKELAEALQLWLEDNYSQNDINNLKEKEGADLSEEETKARAVLSILETIENRNKVSCKVESGVDPCEQGYTCYDSVLWPKGGEQGPQEGDLLCHKDCETNVDCPSSAPNCEETEISRGDLFFTKKICK
jgi:hypothetical protein